MHCESIHSTNWQGWKHAHTKKGSCVQGLLLIIVRFMCRFMCTKFTVVLVTDWHNEPWAGWQIGCRVALHCASLGTLSTALHCTAVVQSSVWLQWSSGSHDAGHRFQQPLVWAQPSGNITKVDYIDLWKSGPSTTAEYWPGQRSRRVRWKPPGWRTSHSHRQEAQTRPLPPLPPPPEPHPPPQNPSHPPPAEGLLWRGFQADGWSHSYCLEAWMKREGMIGR